MSRNGTVVIGLKLVGILGSREGFLRSGITHASFRLSGTIPVLKEAFMNAVMNGASS